MQVEVLAHPKEKYFNRAKSSAGRLGGSGRRSPLAGCQEVLETGFEYARILGFDQRMPIKQKQPTPQLAGIHMATIGRRQ